MATNKWEGGVTHVPWSERDSRVGLLVSLLSERAPVDSFPHIESETKRCRKWLHTPQPCFAPASNCGCACSHNTGACSKKKDPHFFFLSHRFNSIHTTPASVWRQLCPPEEHCCDGTASSHPVEAILLTRGAFQNPFFFPVSDAKRSWLCFRMRGISASFLLSFSKLTMLDFPTCGSLLAWPWRVTGQMIFLSGFC